MVTDTQFREIHIGQIWTTYYDQPRTVEVVNTTQHVNDPISLGDRVRVRNVATGRYHHMQASTLRRTYKLERESRDEQQ